MKEKKGEHVSSSRSDARNEIFHRLEINHNTAARPVGESMESEKVGEITCLQLLT